MRASFKTLEAAISLPSEFRSWHRKLSSPPRSFPALSCYWTFYSENKQYIVSNLTIETNDANHIFIIQTIQYHNTLQIFRRKSLLHLLRLNICLLNNIIEPGLQNSIIPCMNIQE